MRALLASAVLALTLCACAVLPLAQKPCAAGGERQTAELVFQRVSSEAPGVSEADFAHFLDEEVRPRFPDGLTIVDAQGRWTPPAGSPVHGPSKLVMVVLRGQSDDQARLEAVRAAYKRRYDQEALLVATRSACVSL
jgi:hypothetical protein